MDYPYIYKLDGNKLFCTKLVDPLTGQTCDGEIDYDCGFNHLVCTKCGKIYLACNLRDDSIENNIVIKGGSTMKVTITRGKDVLTSSIKSEEVIKRPAPEAPKTGVVKAEVVNVPVPNYDNYRFNGPARTKLPLLNVSVTKGNDVLAGGEKEEDINEAKEASKVPVKKTISSKKTNAKPSKTNVKLVSVDEVTEDKENDKVNIKITVEAKPAVEEVVNTEPDSINETPVQDDAEIVDKEADDVDDEPVDDIDEKYGDLYDDEDNFSRKQPVRTRATKKSSDGDEAPKKKTTTRIPKK